MSESERIEGGLVASALAPDVGTAILPAAPQAPAVDLTADFGLPVSAQRKRWSLSLLAALTVHAIVLAALIPRASDLAEGSGVELDGIDVDVVSAATLERPPSADHRTGTGADVAAAGVIGAGSTALVAAAIPEEADQKRVQERQDTPH